ncbi:hypothetical protein MNBD_GAMMA13-1091 [hydrothermal vent metagenome]|uniref:Uncharacterized protein n=1 Tax=hydrothermal vent metagenome TaxID=652676 RepID=A0A3B0YZH0_9ZZZZ
MQDIGVHGESEKFVLTKSRRPEARACVDFRKPTDFSRFIRSPALRAMESDKRGRVVRAILPTRRVLACQRGGKGRIRSWQNELNSYQNFLRS